MDSLYYVVISLFVVICIMLVGIILLQSSQTGGMGSGISGNAFNAAFGGQGADKLLVKITSVLAVFFMIFAISLNILETPGSDTSRTIDEKSIMDRNKLENTIPVPVGIPAEETVEDSLK